MKTPRVHTVDGWPAKPRALRERDWVWVAFFILDIVSVLVALSFVGKSRRGYPSDSNAIKLLTVGSSSRPYNDRFRWATDISLG